MYEEVLLVDRTGEVLEAGRDNQKRSFLPGPFARLSRYALEGGAGESLASEVSRGARVRLAK